MSLRAAGIVFATLITLQPFLTFSQTQDSTVAPPQDWFLKDPETDQLQGVSAERTYSTLLRDKPARTVLVAVIDSGVDIEHEDLKDVIWTNEDEIPGNGVDDDKNGYVDDIHGWNFIGGKDGNVNADTYEVTREYARLKPKYENVEEGKVPKKQKAEYEYWKKVKFKYDRDSKFNTDQYHQYRKQYEMYINFYRTIAFCDSVLEKVSGKPVLKSSLASIEAQNDTVKFAQQTLTKMLTNIEGDFTMKDFLRDLDEAIDQLQEGVNHFSVPVDYGYNIDFNSRTVIGDDPSNGNERYYGNNDVEGPDARHGTHVAGIIAANRNNEIGIKGIADHVKIMSVRAVPNGDERDKDVANAIMYAVDNGAQIINMSFGKAFSPQKELVDKAVKYAESKGVLLMHAAGNSSDDLDAEPNFPTRKYDSGAESKVWLEIGASAFGAAEDFVGSFSNYGKKSVDLFAPGVQIYATVPDNKYENLQGTSMACPAAAGVAAIIMSYFPEFSAVEVRDILRTSSRKFDNLQVIKPGTKTEKVPFSDLSSTGGLINAYEAVKLAMSLQGKKVGSKK